MRTCCRSWSRASSARSLSAALLAAAGVAACAQVEAPPGGPVDDRPARLLAAEPGSLAVNVAPTAPLRLTFNEKVTRNGFGRVVEVIPTRTFKHVGFDGLTVVLHPDHPWPADTVVVWTLLPTMKDQHGVALARPVGGAFTTGSLIPDGSIGGTVAAAKLKPEQVRVALTTLPAEGQKRGVRWRLVGIGQDGVFRIFPLDVPGGPFRLEAFEDKDGNGRRDTYEAVASVDSLSLTEVNRILNVGVLELIDLEAPVDVWACLLPQPADTLRRRVAWRPLGNEDARATTSPLDSTGCAGAAKLAPGRYAIAIWADLNADGRFGPDSTGVSEPFAEPDTCEVFPARPDTVALHAPGMTIAWTALDTMRSPPVPRELWLAPDH